MHMAARPIDRAALSSPVLRHSLAVTRRNLVRLRNDPEQLLDSTLMPMVLALIFIYVFGGAILGSHEDYRQYLMPGLMVETAAFASRTTGTSLNLDFNTGVMDRFRTLPIARSAVLAGRVLADGARMLLGQVVMLAFAVLIGFRLQNGPLHLLAAIALILVFGMGFSCVSAFIGLVLRSPQTVQSIGFLWMIPLQFGSSMFAPPETMPGWLRVFAEINPMTSVVDAARELTVGTPQLSTIAASLAWSGVLILVFAPLAVRQFQRRS